MRWTDALAEALDLALPTQCGGCGRAGTPWCRPCADEVARSGAAHGVRPSPCPPGFPATWAVAAYAGPLRHALAAYKDDGRRDLAPVLAPMLAAAVRAALPALGALGSAGDPALVVPVPTTAAARRRRGDAPLERLARLACAEVATVARPGPGAWPAVRCEGGALSVRRRLADQAGLTWGARAANLAGAFAGTALVVGQDVVLVDDVVTTGATLVEASRALRQAGAARVVAACIAATSRRGPRPM